MNYNGQSFFHHRIFYLHRRMMRVVLFLILSFFSASGVKAQASFDRKNMDIGNLGFSLTNAGTIGRPDIVNDPQGMASMEYPINSGIEHLFEGGLWIGALINGQTAVSTAAIDAPTGYSTGAAGFEFSADIGNQIQEQSTLSYSDFFSVDATSH